MSSNEMPPWTLKIPTANHFLGVLTNVTKLKRMVGLIRRKLIDKQ